MGARFTMGIGGAPTIARLSRPNHPNYSQLGFRVHPPNPPQGGLSCSLLGWVGVGLWVLAACARDIEGQTIQGETRRPGARGPRRPGGQGGVFFGTLPAAWGPRPLGYPQDHPNQTQNTPTVLTGRSAGGLGRAPMQMVSGALGSLGFGALICLVLGGEWGNGSL